MTAEAILEICRSAACMPLTSMQQRIGFPRESRLGGPVMRKIAAGIAQSRWRNGSISDGPWCVISFAQTRALEKELERPILNRGDILFGMILTATIDRGEDGERAQLRWLNKHGGYIDIREPV